MFETHRIIFLVLLLRIGGKMLNQKNLHMSNIFLKNNCLMIGFLTIHFELMILLFRFPSLCTQTLNIPKLR